MDRVLNALPVALDLRGGLADAARRLVEGELGWQPVDDVTAALVPPAVRFADVAAPVAEAGIPTVLVVAGEVSPLLAAEAVHRLRPAAVIGWPVQRDQLEVVVAEVVNAPRDDRAELWTLRVGGAAGGVGTTTVALALAGLIGWKGAATLIVSSDGTQLPDEAPLIEPGALGAADLWTRAVTLPGVPRTRTVRTATPADGDPGGGAREEAGVAGSRRPGDVIDPRIAAVVYDAGVADDVDVLVCRPDAPGLAALHRVVAGTVVVVGDGPVPAGQVDAAIGTRRRIDLPHSARVARAAVVGRVPSALPGWFVRALAPLVPERG